MTKTRSGLGPRPPSQRPSIRILLALLRAVYSPFVYERIILPIIQDQDHESAEQLSGDAEESKASVSFSGYWILFSALGALSVDSLGKAVRRLSALSPWNSGTTRRIRQHPASVASLLDRQEIYYRRLAVAVSLTIVVGFGTYLLSVHQGMRSQTAPSARVVVVDLIPTDTQFRSAGFPTTVSVPEWADNVVLILNRQDVQTYPRYNVDFHAGTDLHGAPLWRLMDIVPSEAGNFVIQVPRRFLTSPARIRLYGLDGTAQIVLAEYTVNLL